MVSINAFFASALFLLCSKDVLASPNLAVMAHGGLRPHFTHSGTSGFGGTNSTGLFPTGTGTGCIGPTGTGSIGTTAAIYPIMTPISEHRLIHYHSGGFSTSAIKNGTTVGPTGTNTGVVCPTGTGATGTVSATGAVLYPGYMPVIDERSQKAARRWWG